MQLGGFNTFFSRVRASAATLLVASGLLFGASPVRATSVIAQDFDSLVLRSDYVVRAVVKSISSEFRATPTGRAIFTKVELQVTETIAGKPPSPLVLDVLGGTVDGVTLHVDGVPKFRVGEENILLVQGNGRQFFPLSGISDGKYPIIRDVATGVSYVARSNGVALYDVKDVKNGMTSAATAQAMHAGQAPLTPEAFAAKIRATAQNKTNSPTPPSVAN